MAARAEPEVGGATRRKAVVAATIGNFVEWYDFTIYLYFATVIATLFFPSEDRFASLLSTFAVFGVAFVVRPEGAFYSWGWRVPFLIALPLGLIGLYLRLRLEDTPNFRAVQRIAEVESAPLRQTIRTYGKDILKVVGVIVFGTALTYLFLFLPTYVTETLGLTRFQALAANVVGVLSLLAVCPTAALLSETLGRKTFLVGAALGTAIFAVPGFLLLQGSFPAILLAHAVFGALVGLFGGAYPAAFSELFPTKVRYSALSLGYSVSVSIFGGFSPLIFTYLLRSTGSPISPAFYIIGAALVSLIAALTVPETAKKPLPDT